MTHPDGLAALTAGFILVEIAPRPRRGEGRMTKAAGTPRPWLNGFCPRNPIALTRPGCN